MLIIAPIIPFVVLVRTSAYQYLTHQLSGWFALTMGVAATILLLFGYSLFVVYRYQKQFRACKYAFRGITILVLAYTLYGVLYYSSLHTAFNLTGLKTMRHVGTSDHLRVYLSIA